ncbi:unnamed protein product [Rhizophagus irregularis]|nr:unnamed protein product [Rhizophagus irregularis]
MSSRYFTRPPIVTNAPDGYIELMKECWHSEPNKRPTATDLLERIDKLWTDEWIRFGFFSSTEITKSLDIGPVTTNNSGAIYRSRSLSDMISFEMSLRSSRSLSINLGTDKRKFEDLTDNDDDGQCIKRKKLCENEINDSSHSTSSSGSRSRPSSFARMYSSPTDTVGFPPDGKYLLY